MTRKSCFDLKAIRNEIGFSQSEFADRIGVSLRTIQSCEQGWRNPSPAVEKAALLFLMSHLHGSRTAAYSCWDTVHCPEEERLECVVYQTRQGQLCWLLTGHVCKGNRLHSWEDKKKICCECEFFRELFPEGVPTL